MSDYVYYAPKIAVKLQGKKPEIFGCLSVVISFPLYDVTTATDEMADDSKVTVFFFKVLQLACCCVN